ncbi:MAG: FecR family protein [Bacteroidales bacterium]|nr:FecR family protein [Bacteroidales bacterium]
MRIEKAIRELLDENREVLSSETKETLKFIFETDDGRIAFDEWMNSGNKHFIVPYDVDFEALYKRITKDAKCGEITHAVQYAEKSGHRRSWTEKYNGVVNLFYKCAAVLVIPLLLYVFVDKYLEINKKEFTELTAQEKIETILRSREKYEALGLEYCSPAGSQVKVTLADSSVVTLNGNSKITLFKSFNSENRYLKLEGEAYFDVAKNDSLGFVVNAQGVNVVALGTSFYVQAYPQERTVEAVLLDGVIGVSKDAESVNENYSHILKPNDRYVYTKTSGKEEINVEEQTKPYEAWTYGELIFDDTPMGDIIKKLEHYYGVDIIVKNNKIYSYHLTATWHGKSISQIMELLKYTSPIVYEITRDVITIDLKQNK